MNPKQIAADERTEIVAYIRKAACHCLINEGAEFVCKTQGKARHVLGMGFASLADAIENGAHRENSGD